jgi:hypothetical protein
MRTSFHHQPEAQHPNFQLSTSWQADYPIFSPQNAPKRTPHLSQFMSTGANLLMRITWPAALSLG